MNRIRPAGHLSQWPLVLCITLLVLVLQGCGANDSSNDQGYALAGGGVGGTGFSSGTVSSFGSIYTNGIRFDTRHAAIIIEGHLVGEGDTAARKYLNLGQVVRIEGDIHDDNTGVALRIYYDKNIEGPVNTIESLDPFTRRMTVLGQTIIADSKTEYVDTDLDALATDDDQVLEISGFFSDDGSLIAEYIAKKEMTETFTVTGIVEGLDAPSHLFRIGELTVTYGVVETAMPVFANGDWIRVKGVVGLNDTLVAEEIFAWEPLDYRLEAEEIKFEGVVHRTADDDDDDDDDGDDDDDDDSDDDDDDGGNARQVIVVGTVPVRVDEHTTFLGIDRAADLTTGMAVMVYGELTGGVVNARRIEIKYDTLRSLGTVAALDSEEQTFSINGQTVRVNALTTVRSDDVPLNFQDIVIGDDVVVYGWIRTDESITALRVWVVNDSAAAFWYPSTPYCCTK